MRYLLSVLLAFALIAMAAGQEAISYEVYDADLAHHEIRVVATFPALPDAPLKLRFPQASPGRYALHHFAKNMYDLRATDGRGRELKVYRTDLASWEVTGHDGQVQLAYTLYANRADGTYAGVDNRKLHLNMPAVFIYGVGLEHRPVLLSFKLENHRDWQVATQLERLDDNRFRAPNYYYFFDSPTMVGEIDRRSWQSSSDGRKYTIEIAIMHEGTDEQLDKYAENVKAIVEEEKAIYGELPQFDFGKYTFLLSFNPWVDGDGMEHRNSTVCSGDGALSDDGKAMTGVIAHEFFHAWNVERLRPRSLEPFNFDKPNMSDELWFAEGFTSYYDDLVLCRTGIISQEDYLSALSNGVNQVLNGPGRRHRNPIEMSRHAPFVDAAVYIDPVNYANTFISYYTYGNVLGLCLDLSLRNRKGDLSLDDYMRYLWQHFGRKEIPYTVADLEAALAEVTGDKSFAADFFNRYIRGSQLPDLKDLFSEMGVVMRPKSPKQAGFYGASFHHTEKGARVQGPVLETNPLYQAGLDEGDLLLSVDGRPVNQDNPFDDMPFEPGRRYTIRFIQNGIETTGTFTATQDPTIELLTAESADEKANRASLKRREDWLSSKRR